MTPEIPPSLSEENQHLLAEIEARQPAENVELLHAKAFPWIPLAAALLLFALVAWLLQRKKPAPSPQEKALVALTANPDIATLSHIVRRFIQEQYGLLSPYLTTEEFLLKAAHHPLLQGESGQKLSLFLLAADQVKFAGRSPTSHDVEMAQAYARSFCKTRG